MEYTCFACGRIKDKNESSTSVCPVCGLSLGMETTEDYKKFLNIPQARKNNPQYRYKKDSDREDEITILNEIKSLIIIKEEFEDEVKSLKQKSNRLNEQIKFLEHHIKLHKKVSKKNE